jgi:hypothetical protein
MRFTAWPVSGRPSRAACGVVRFVPVLACGGTPLQAASVPSLPRCVWLAASFIVGCWEARGTSPLASAVVGLCACSRMLKPSLGRVVALRSLPLQRRQTPWSLPDPRLTGASSGPAASGAKRLRRPRPSAQARRWAS